MKKTFFLPLIIFFCLQSCIQEKTCKLNIHFKGKEYDKLNLVISVDNENPHKIIIPGQTTDGKTWSFIYPDSIYDIHVYTSIIVPSDIDSMQEDIGFKAVIDNDTLMARSYSFSKGITNIEAVYLKTEIYPNSFYKNKENQIAIRTIYADQFLIQPNSDKELLSSIERMGHYYSMFYVDDSLNYNDLLEMYIYITKKYPESHGLLASLARNLTKYNSKQDVEKVYNCFSKKIIRSYFGKKIYNFLTLEFENSNLPKWDSNKIEPIIKDTSKYNLLVFSASWCSPCHKQIPLLKEIYSNLKENLIITYVSVDEEKGIEDWGILMKKEEIPWRSLLAKDNLKNIKEKYFVNGIPHTILVYPGGKNLEIMDVRNEKNYNKLFELVQN